MERRHHIAVVEDDPELGPLIVSLLEREGFTASLAATGADLDQAFRQQAADLVVLDLMLPGEDGLAICRRLRAGSDIPILMLTARKEEIDRIIGLELGADDYLGKPFSPRELVARIRAILRRTAGPPAKPGEVLHFDGWALDLAARTLRGEGGEAELTSGEFALLAAFVAHPGRVLTRDVLMGLSHRRITDAIDRTVDVQVSRLRRKIETDPKEPRLIRTVRNGGYIFSATVRRG